MRWIYRRLMSMVITVFTVITIIFFLIRLMPGNPIEYLVNQYVKAGMTYDEAYRFVSAAFSISINKPLHIQYLEFIWSVLTGNLGNSIIFRTPVSYILAYALPWTVFTVSLGLFLSFILGVFLGLLCAYKRNSWIDRILSFLATSWVAIPNYVLAYILIIVFCRYLGILPMRGSYDPLKVTPGFNLPFIINVIHHAILPILCYFAAGFGTWLLRMRSSTISILGEQYIAYARARGLTERRIMWKYVGRTAILPIFSFLAISIGYIFGGSAIIESIFQYPGIGSYISYAVFTRDYSLMQGVFFLLTLSVTFSNFIADILFSKLDPRVKAE